MSRVKVLLLFTVFLMVAPSVIAKGQYLTPQEFLQQSFGIPSQKSLALWLDDNDKRQAKEIFKREYAGFRVRYWQQGEKTAWIFDEIGKTRPITIGVVVVARQIERISILEFRESRGSEIRYPFFTQQFIGLTLQGNGTELSASIDGITGATLSVRAATRVARFALYLDGQLESEGRSFIDE